MTELVNTLSPEAEKSMKLLAESLRGNSVFAFLEAEPEAQRANDLATRALAASREAEFTLRKVEQLSHGLPDLQGLPDSFSFLPSAILSALSEKRGVLLCGAVWCFMLSAGCIGAISQTLHEGKKPWAIIPMIVVWLIAVAVPICVFGSKVFHMSKEKSKENAMKKVLGSFNWSAANAPQTTATTDDTILRANEAMRRSAEPDCFDEMNKRLAHRFQRRFR